MVPIYNHHYYHITTRNSPRLTRLTTVQFYANIFCPLSVSKRIYSSWPYGSGAGRGNLFSQLLIFSMHGRLLHDYTHKPLTLDSESFLTIPAEKKIFFFAVRNLWLFSSSSHKKQQLYYSCNIKYMSFSNNTPCHSSQINHCKCCSQETLYLKVIMTIQDPSCFIAELMDICITLIGIPHHLNKSTTAVCVFEGTWTVCQGTISFKNYKETSMAIENV